MTRDPSEHELVARQSDERNDGPVEVLVVIGQAPAAVDPGDGALDDPSPRDNLESLNLRETLDHINPPGGIFHGPTLLRVTVGAVDDDCLQE